MYEFEKVNVQGTVPFDPFTRDFVNMGGKISPYTFNGWVSETLSWKKTCYLSANLSGDMPLHRLKGSDAVRLLNDHSVNNFTNMKVGAGRHIIMCSERGNIIVHGVALRFSEDEFGLYALQPYINFLANSGRYKVEPVETKFHDYLYQVAGPRSLEILEQAAQEDLHDIKFQRFRTAHIAGHKVRILRMGMAGTLAYEVHGPAEDSTDVYNAIYAAGKPLGLEKLGWLAYTCNHTENGFPQGGLHFVCGWEDHEEFRKLVSSGFYAGAISPIGMSPKGSLGSEIQDYYCNPIELGWEKMVKFDHDFTGRAALEKIAASPHRQVVTLRWNLEDVLDVYASLLRSDEKPYKIMELPQNFYENLGAFNQDRVVDKDGKIIGKSTARVYTLYYQSMISLAVLDPQYTALGTEVMVVWGGPGDREKQIRATVDRYPFLDLPLNQKYDIESIPRFKA